MSAIYKLSNKGRHAMQPDDIIKKAIELCIKYSVKDCILFGSRAKGTAPGYLP